MEAALAPASGKQIKSPAKRTLDNARGTFRGTLYLSTGSEQTKPAHKRRLQGIVHKEGVHGLCGAGPQGIGVGAGGAPARPGVSHAIDGPVLLDLAATTILPAPDRVGVTARDLAIGRAGGIGKAGMVGAARGIIVGLHPLLHNL